MLDKQNMEKFAFYPSFLGSYIQLTNKVMVYLHFRFFLLNVNLIVQV